MEKWAYGLSKQYLAPNLPKEINISSRGIF